MEVPGVVLPCGHVHERPEPKPSSFKATCGECKRTFHLVEEAGSWKSTEVK